MPTCASSSRSALVEASSQRRTHIATRKRRSKQKEPVSRQSAAQHSGRDSFPPHTHNVGRSATVTLRYAVAPIIDGRQRRRRRPFRPTVSPSPGQKTTSLRERLRRPSRRDPSAETSTKETKKKSLTPTIIFTIGTRDGCCGVTENDEKKYRKRNGTRGRRY